ncbi:MAG: heavy metal translocating P-type ATPase [Acidobacteriota bacterium]
MTHDARLEFRIHGMDCADEIATLKAELADLAGGEQNLAFDVLKGKMIVTGEALSPQAIVEAVARTGMRAVPWRTDSPERGDRRGRWAAPASGALTLGGFLLHALMSGSLLEALGSEGTGARHAVPLAAAIAYAAAVACGTWLVLPKALSAARRLRPDMNLLMTIAIAGAIGIGEWFEAATVAFLFALALELEAWSVGRARHAVEALLEVAPTTARVRQPDGSFLEVPAATVPVGSLILIRPGERFPLDGTVVKGSSHVNQAPSTGESMPVPKKSGDPAFAGTINGDGALEVEATKAASDTTLAHIVRLVEEAQSRRAPAQQWVDGFARIYTPAILVTAAATLVLAPSLLGGSWQSWLYRALVLLVIGCPCALVISTPVSVVAALAAAAKHGVLVKGGAYIEAPATLAVLALDKTGTLTEGRPDVVELVSLGEHTETEVLGVVAAMEAHSDHPLAHAIARYAARRGVEPRNVESFQTIPGKGATATVDGKPYWLGSHRYLEERGQEEASVHDQLERMSQAGRTVVIVGDAQHVCGLIAIADAVRPEARRVVTALRALGLSHVVMLTGDNEATARKIAAATGVDEVRADLLPADKVASVEELVKRYGRVGMVGDGINDAPALASATLGIAMGAAGSDAAIETADVALMSDDLTRLPWLIAHSRRTLRTIRQNIAFSIAVKAVFVVLAVTGRASLWHAIAADMGASLLVIFNGLRLLGEAPPALPTSDITPRKG